MFVFFQRLSAWGNWRRSLRKSSTVRHSSAPWRSTRRAPRWWRRRSLTAPPQHKRRALKLPRVGPQTSPQNIALCILLLLMGNGLHFNHAPTMYFSVVVFLLCEVFSRNSAVQKSFCSVRPWHDSITWLFHSLLLLFLYDFFVCVFVCFFFVTSGSSSSQKKTSFHKIVRKHKQKKEKPNVREKGELA